jgi:hypothetical protein
MNYILWVKGTTDDGRKNMNHTRTIKKHTMLLASNPETLFPLLCPVREFDWIEPWRCKMVYSDSGFAEQDCIFQTNFPQDGPEDTWVVSRYEKPTLVEFVRVNGIRAIRYTITLRQVGEGRTESEWSQVVTGLSDEGNKFVEGLLDGDFSKRMQMLERMLNHYLTTGKMLKLSEI